jgi:Glycosyltransferase like family
MIAFGCSITKPDVYGRCAEAGLERVAEPDSKLLARPAIGSIFKSYNALLDEAAGLEDLEALVLVHQDTEIADPDFCAKVREALRDPEVGVVGCVGAVDVRSIAWWEGSVSTASFVHRYEEHGGGDLPAFSWAWEGAPPFARTGEVDTVDGFLLVLSPWTVRNIRFDESLGMLLHGYDFDFCLQVREAGRKVVTSDFRAVHHHSLELVAGEDDWVDAHIKVSEKWYGRMAKVGVHPGSWKERARRAEAERDSALALARTNALRSAARGQELERVLADTTESISWRLTAPLRLFRGRPRARDEGEPLRRRLRARLAR